MKVVTYLLHTLILFILVLPTSLATDTELEQNILGDTELKTGVEANTETGSFFAELIEQIGEATGIASLAFALLLFAFVILADDDDKKVVVTNKHGLGR